MTFVDLNRQHCHSEVIDDECEVRLVEVCHDEPRLLAREDGYIYCEDECGYSCGEVTPVRCIDECQCC